MEIPFLNYPLLFESIQEKLIATFKGVGKRGVYILQRDVESFENNLEQFLGIKRVISVANGTDALL